MKNNSEEQFAMNQQRYKELEGNELLLKKVIRAAQFESEMDLGVNPANFDQADTGYLSEQDFEYIHRVMVLVEKRLKDSVWLAKTIDEIDNTSLYRRETIRGIRFDDELFKAGRGILEAYYVGK